MLVFSWSRSGQDMDICMYFGSHSLYEKLISYAGVNKRLSEGPWVSLNAGTRTYPASRSLQGCCWGYLNRIDIPSKATSVQPIAHPSGRSSCISFLQERKEVGIMNGFAMAPKGYKVELGAVRQLLSNRKRRALLLLVAW